MVAPGSTAIAPPCWRTKTWKAMTAVGSSRAIFDQAGREVKLFMSQIISYADQKASRHAHKIMAPDQGGLAGIFPALACIRLPKSQNIVIIPMFAKRDRSVIDAAVCAGIMLVHEI